MPSLTTGIDRRELLRLIAAGVAGLAAGCSKPDQPIFPAADAPFSDEEGTIRRYATTLTLGGYGRGVTGLVTENRPIKIEGNARHPASLGATDMFAEAAILDLYDPQRLRAPIGPDGISGWALLERQAITALAGSDGLDVRLLTGRITSPALLARIAGMQRRYPALRHVRAEPIDDDAALAGAVLAFGRPLTMRPRWAEARVVVALDADPLGPGPDQIANGRGWVTRRRGAGLRLYAFEPSMTLTGANADRRATTHPAIVADVLLAIAAAIGGGPAPGLPEPVATRAAQAIADLQAAPGAAIVLVGRGQPPAAHALAAWVNAMLRAPVDWIAPVDPDPAPHAESLAGLAAEMHAGRVRTLLMLDTNPLLHAPPALRFRAALGRVPLSIAATRFADETATAATWSVPLSDPLESWGDARAPDGTASIVQPLVRPFYRTRDAFGMLDLIDPVGAQPPLACVRAAWAAQAGADPDRWWRDVLVAGVIPGSAAPGVPVGMPTRAALAPASAVQQPLIVTLAPSGTLWDGRFATNAWAQECPDPLTKEVWGAGLRLHPADAAAAGLAEGAPVRVGAAGVTTVRIVSGQAKGVATLPLGYGRKQSGPIAGEGGANGYLLRGKAGGWAAPVTIEPAPHGPVPIATQGLFALEGETATLFPVVAPGGKLPPAGPLRSLLPPRQPVDAAPAQWAMAIDTSACIGCNACVVACQAENNVPPIGPEEMARGRDMHWLRVDRYDSAGEAGRVDDPQPGFQPVPCMHCEAAPCEPVCPVEASVHDQQGLNVQVYNRCIGTRTCQANCPYKVRRFNFRDYAETGPWGALDQGPVAAQRNPEVTVRARGVMEKCTYCVQRISAAVREADATGAPLGEVRTACQSACPTRAITFGDLGSPQIVGARESPLHYALLGELGTRPRTTYLAKVRDA